MKNKSDFLREAKFVLKLFHGVSGKIYPLFFLSFLFNLAGALLEGVAYGFVILAFSAISGEGNLEKFAIIPILPQLLAYFGGNLFIGAVICGILSQFLKSTFCFFAISINAKLGMDLQYSIQSKIYENILSFSFSCINRYKIGELATYMKSPIEFVRPFLESLNNLILSALLVIVSFIVMIKISFSLTVFSMSIFILSALLQKYIIKKSHIISKVLYRSIEKFSNQSVQCLSGLRIIHLYNFQKIAFNKMALTLRKFSKFSKKLILFNAAINSINEIVGIVLICSCLIVGYWLVSENYNFVLPALLGFVTVAYRLSGKVSILMASLNQISILIGCLNQIKVILNLNDKEFVTEKERKINFSKFISINDLEFHYPNNSKLIFKSFSCDIPKGATIAIIGESGAGKSTLLDLLTGLYHPTKGQIKIDGFDLNESDLVSWREKIGVVSQDTYIFNDSIEENIRFGKPDATEEEIIEATKMANAHHFICHLSHGYHTVVGERGYRLSGGERQRIALARALIRNPEILILDEATSNLDTNSEQIIQEAIEKYHGSKTLIIVAHRLSTIKHADKIFVIEKGKLIETGSHEELLMKNGAYAQFWNVQFKKEPKNFSFKNYDKY